jgi:ketosteroid isomerase-like protein
MRLPPNAAHPIRLTPAFQADKVVTMAAAAQGVTGAILDLERAALERWGRGDPDGFLEISAPDLSYFDPFTERRLDGLDALRSMYEDIRGKIHIDRFEIIEPRVQVCADVAVLTYRFKSYGGGGSMHWNATEVYRRDDAGWRILHSHWALHKPRQSTSLT